MILVYYDEGVGEFVLSHLIQSLEQKHILYRLVDSKFIITQDLSYYSALIIPGGADLGYCKKLDGVGNTKIKDYISSGGNYIGICAGAYYACKTIEFTGLDYTVSGDRELAFFTGKAKGSLPELTNNHYFDKTENSKNIVTISFNGSHFDSYYHGGPEFLNAQDHQIVACYSNHKVAAVADCYGKGKFLLTSFHFEVEAEFYPKATQCVEQLLVEKELIQKLTLSSRDIFWNYLLPILQK